jgi:hypothetical protein
MANYAFSVGKIAIGSGTAIATCTGITVRTDGGPVEFRGGDYRLPMWIELGAKSVEITIESAKFDVDPSEMDNNYVSLTLSTGNEGGGLSATITNCKVVSYEVRQSQDAFVVSTLVLRKAENPTL